VIVRHDVAHDVVMNAWLGAVAGTVPSVSADSYPTTALEAAATGTPLVASRIGGLPEIVADGETGLLVPPGDAGALTGALQRLLGDADLRRALGAAAVIRAESFELDTVVTRLEAIYGIGAERTADTPFARSAVA
jgi:glycosyltransferase involved in cell wall biosynthesis